MDATHRRSVSVLLTGDFEHADFASLRTWLAGCAGVQVEAALLEDVQAAPRQVVAICQSRPGQFSQDQVESLHRQAPLASLLAVLGSWCEGELRSGRPWHGVERVYWYDAVGRLQGMFDQTIVSHACRTLSPAEHIERKIAHLTAAGAGMNAVIIAPRCADYEALADLCRVLKIAPHWQRAADPVSLTAPQLVLLVGDDLAHLESAGALPSLRRVWPAARLFALLNFPRGDEIASLRAAGFDGVLGKPLLLTDLLSSIGDLSGTVSRQSLAG